MKKKFKVLRDLGEKEPGQLAYLMVSPDGDCWQVFRNKLTTAPWKKDEVYDIDIKITQPVQGDRVMVPRWDKLFCDQAFQYTLREPYETVVEAWGEEVAKKSFSADDNAVPKRHVKVDIEIRPDLFTATSEVEEEDKAVLANSIVRFLVNDFRSDLFTKKFHKGIIRLFGLPRMEYRDFWDRYFTTAASKTEFLQQIAKHVVRGDPAHSFVDVEKVVQNYVINRTLPRWVTTNKRADLIRKRALLISLIREIGIPEEYHLPGKK
jgi:hypothetical protein